MRLMITLINTYTDLLNSIASECDDIIESLALNDAYRENFKLGMYDKDTLAEWEEFNKQEAWERKHAQLDESILPDNFWNE